MHELLKTKTQIHSYNMNSVRIYLNYGNIVIMEHDAINSKSIALVIELQVY